MNVQELLWETTRRQPTIMTLRHSNGVRADCIPTMNQNTKERYDAFLVWLFGASGTSPRLNSFWLLVAFIVCDGRGMTIICDDSYNNGRIVVGPSISTGLERASAFEGTPSCEQDNEYRVLGALAGYVLPTPVVLVSR